MSNKHCCIFIIKHSESTVYIKLCKKCGKFSIHWWGNISLKSYINAYKKAYEVFNNKPLTKKQKVKIVFQATKEYIA